MFRTHGARRRTLAVLGSVGVLAVAGAAYAYFTATGSGTGTGTAGTSSALTIHGSVTGAMYPGVSRTVSFTIDNPSDGHQYVNKIHLVSVAADTGHSDCVVNDFTMSDVTAAQDFAKGDGQAVTATGTLAMANTAVSQDACKGATLTLNLTSN